MSSAEPTQQGHLALKTVMMPRDTNPYGTIFGGVVLSYIDQAGAVGARHEMRGAGWPSNSVVTVAMDSVEFHHPVYVGDVLSFYTRLIRVGTTSITMHVVVQGDRLGESLKLTEATVTYVAIEDAEGSRKPVPIRSD